MGTQASSGAKGSVTDVVRQGRTTLGDVKRGTLERVEGYEAQYVPKVVKYDKWYVAVGERQGGLVST